MEMNKKEVNKKFEDEGRLYDHYLKTEELLDKIQNTLTDDEYETIKEQMGLFEYERECLCQMFSKLGYEI